MALSDDFKEAVLQNKKTKVRIMMKDNLLLDSSGAEFDEMLNYAIESNPGLMDEHNGEIFKPSDEWDEDYLNDQMVAVVNNFSAERIDLLKRMVKKLYFRSEPDETSEKNNHTNQGDAQKASVPVIKVAGGMVAAIGAGTLIYGIAAEASIVVPVIGGAAIVTGAFMILKK